MKNQENVVVKNKCHSRGMLSGIPTSFHLSLEGEGGTKYRVRGKDNKANLTYTPSWGRGFTLIELLVVVLIIGILAAVAVPQYQKVVEKSRGVEALVLLKSIYQVAQIFYMEHGTWPSSFRELDISYSCLPNVLNNSGVRKDACTTQDQNWSLFIIEDGNSKGIQAVRITGEFANKVNFFMWNNYQWSSLVPPNTVICSEYLALENAGSYCEKIWHASFLFRSGSAASSNRYYRMP